MFRSQIPAVRKFSAIYSLVLEISAGILSLGGGKPSNILKLKVFKMNRGSLTTVLLATGWFPSARPPLCKPGLQRE